MRTASNGQKKLPHCPVRKQAFACLHSLDAQPVHQAGCLHDQFVVIAELQQGVGEIIQEPVFQAFEVRFLQAGHEQCKPGFIVAEHQAVTPINGIEVGVPASQRAVFCKRLAADVRQFGGEFFGAVNDH